MFDRRAGQGGELRGERGPHPFQAGEMLAAGVEVGPGNQEVAQGGGCHATKPASLRRNPAAPSLERRGTFSPLTRLAEERRCQRLVWPAETTPSHPSMSR